MKIIETKHMNQNHLNHICERFQIGYPTGDVTSVYGSRGGSLMWHVTTENSQYAIKQLSPDLDMTNEKMIAKYELSETIADRFKCEGIPAIPALKTNFHHLLLIENTGYLVYPWVEGRTLNNSEVSEIHGIKIAELSAKLHRINLNVPEAGAPRFDIYTDEKIVSAIETACLLNFPFSDMLKQNKNLILSANRRYQAGIPQLIENAVITHGDLDKLNVIWDDVEQPHLVDWESARKMDPTREIVRTSLGWSGLGTDHFSITMYTKMLNAYMKSGGMLQRNKMESALHAVFGSMINWMLYNISSACSKNNEQKIEVEINEITGVMDSMNRLNDLLPDLMAIHI